MGTIGKIARRGFLLGSAAIVGGVAFGYYEYHRAPTNPLVPSGDAVTLNPYLIIDGDGITIITPRAEMGQGIQTTLAALVAEELDVALDNIRTRHGPASDAYANATVISIGAPFAEYAETTLQSIASDSFYVAGEIHWDADHRRVYVDHRRVR